MKIKALILKTTLFAALLICLLALSSCGDSSSAGLSFTSNGDGTCFVSGIGDCEEENIVIPTVSPRGDTVTGIGEKAFFDCFTMKSLTIPESVTHIGDNAFRGSIYLKEISFPKSVTSIGKTVLADCKSLEKLTVEQGNPKYSSFFNCLIETKSKTLLAGCNTSKSPNQSGIVTVTTIADYAFFDMNELKEFDLTDITHVGERAFESCDKLSNITGASLLVEIGDYAFAACDSMKSFELDQNFSLETIGNYAFHACDSIKKFYFPKTVKTVGDGAFWSCENMRDVIASDISAWAQIDFGSSSASPLNNKNARLLSGEMLVTDVEIAEGATKVGDFAFWGCDSIISISLPDSVESIGEYAFSDCSSLVSIELGEGVRSIAPLAFRNCSELLSVSIPKATESIGEFAFFACSKLELITVDEGNAKYVAIGNCLIDVGAKTLLRGSNASAIPEDGSVEIIADYAFNNCSSLISVKIPASIKRIGFAAFRGCDALADATFADVDGWTAHRFGEDSGITFVPSASALNATYSDHYLIND